ncbi:hypothetical protein ACIPPN_09765 [Streptomyces diastaticus]|uniref:hypothetical protein n=1 Tax=Streptomyces TaxID=1883 RepID=UPI001F1529D8|nr:hypothetical protein [Streptomyces sp. ADI98-12]
MGTGAEPDGSSLPDDAWEKFLRESVEGTADAPKEPSARARSVAHRLRDQPEPPGWRTYSPAARPIAPVRRERRRLVGPLIAALVLAVVVAVGWFAGPLGGGDTNAPAAAPETGRPTQAPPPEPASGATLDAPFRGSPAARWASGAEGITVPKAESTGWMDAAGVERALDRSLAFLTASNLDAGVLRGEHPGEAVQLVNPRQQDVQTYLKAAFRDPGEKNDPLLLFSRFDGSRTRLVGDEVRTRGRITYKEGKLGAVEVTSDVTFVYPVVRATEGADEVVRTIVRRETVMSWDDPDKVLTEPGTFSLLSYRLHVTNGGCGASTGYFAPPFGTERPDTTAGTEIDPYDRSAALRDGGADEACEGATRS